MKVLVCELDPATAAVIRRELEAQGHEVAEAHDEAETLRRVRTEWCEMVILDGTLGLTPLRALRAAPWTQDVFVIVLTACLTHEAICEAYREGADMVLTKPIKPHELLTFRPRD